MNVQILMSPGCGHGQRTLELVADVLRTAEIPNTVETILVVSAEDAARLAFPGSPTVRVNGIDIEPEPPTSVALG
jgi:hypothetical protein